jgi:hypothetical protein
MTIKQTSDAVAVTGAGTFERIVSHDEALEAAKALIDGHFNNKGGRGVHISIPAQPDNTDVLLVDYIKQQRALSRLASTPAVSTDEIVAVLEEGNRRGLYDTTKIGPELVAFLDDRRGMLASLRDEMSDGYRGWLDDAVDALRIASERLAALTTPAPAEDDDPDDHLGGKLAAAVERELDRIEQRNSTRQDFTPAFDRELARKVIMAGFGLFSCRGWTTASGYQWMGLLETLGLDKARPVSPAPAVSIDEIDELLYSVIRMPLSNKGGELVRWRKTMSGRLSAILSRLRGEAE